MVQCQWKIGKYVERLELKRSTVRRQSGRAAPCRANVPLHALTPAARGGERKREREREKKEEGEKEEYIHANIFAWAAANRVTVQGARVQVGGESGTANGSRR